MTANVVLSSNYRKSYRGIDGSVKPKVLDFIFKLMNDPTSKGLDLKTPQGVSDTQIKTARVDLFWRAVLVVSPSGQDYVLVAVKPHDDAYDLAAKLRYGVNEVTGVFEVFDEVALEDALRVSAPERAATPVLAGLKISDLRTFGVDSDVAADLLKIADEDAFLTVVGSLPDLQANALADLAAGRPVEDVWEDYVKEEFASEQVDTEDWDSAFQRAGSQLSFVSGADAEALQAVLEGDLAAWRVWLHPLQRKLAYHTGWNGPYRVTGAAGTGKTVTAIHRARHLASQLGPDERVLLTTYTRNLAETVRGQLVDLAGPDILDSVDVLNLDAVAQRVLNARQDRSGARRKMVGDEDVRGKWETAASASDGRWGVSFLQEEWSDVVLALGITDRAGYLTASRAGRGTRLTRPQRADVWKAIEAFTALMNADDAMTHTQAAAEAAAVLRAGERPYRHVVVDEAQDLHAAHWRLLRALAEPGTDDLFIVGDAHQRIYGRPLVLSRYGIETRGRSRRLTVNYRTSRQILDWCSAVMLGAVVDDLEDGSDDLVGARSLFTGPAVEKHPGPQEDASVVEVVGAWHSEGLGWGEIAVVAPTGVIVERLAGVLRERGVPARIQDRSAVDEAVDEVHVMTMHRAKGLEFRGVVIAGIGAAQFARQGDPQRWRNLLYVAGSRARERLALVWSGELTPLVRG